MSEQVEVVRRIHEAGAPRDFDVVIPNLHPEVEIHDHDLPDAGVYHGHEGYRRSEANWAASWASYCVKDEEFVEVGDRVLVLFTLTATGRGSGVEIERKDGILYSFRDGLVSRIDYYDDQGRARAAAEQEVAAS